MGWLKNAWQEIGNVGKDVLAYTAYAGEFAGGAVRDILKNPSNPGAIFNDVLRNGKHAIKQVKRYSKDSKILDGGFDPDVLKSQLEDIRQTGASALMLAYGAGNSMGLEGGLGNLDLSGMNLKGLNLKGLDFKSLKGGEMSFLKKLKFGDGNLKNIFSDVKGSDLFEILGDLGGGKGDKSSPPAELDINDIDDSRTKKSEENFMPLVLLGLGAYLLMSK